MTGVLEGIRVVDLSSYLAGPVCTTILADFGAEVIKVEPPVGAEDRRQGPSGPTGVNLRFLTLARNKKLVTLDMNQPKGKDLFRRLVQQADVVVENFSPPVKEKLGVTYESLRKLRPNIILTSISAYGTDGPDAERVGFDMLIQAESGSMDFTGFDFPTRAQIGWVDFSTAFNAVIGTLLALMQRSKTGEGQLVDLSLLDTGVSMVGFQGPAIEWQAMGVKRTRVGNAGYHFFCDTFEAKDGVVIVAVPNTPLWRRLAKVMDRSNLANDPRLATDSDRYFNAKLIREPLSEWIASRTVAETMETMAKAHVPCGKVRDVGEMLQDAQVAARQLFKTMDLPGIGPVIHPRVPIKLSSTPATIRTTAPGLGGSNAEVYCGLLGLSEQELVALSRDKVV